MEIIDKIIKEEFKKRDLKYRIFFTGLFFEKYIFQIEKVDKAYERGNLLRNYYFLMRYLDDIIDGDIIINNYTKIEDRIDYLESKLNYLLYINSPKDSVDLMLNKCLCLANEIGFSLEHESELIIKSLLYDGKRILYWKKNNEPYIASFNELNSHFYDLDIIGTISGCLKIFDENLKYVDLLYYLGTSSRKYYDLRDFVEDIKRGIVNISLEDMKKYNITANDIYCVMRLNDKYIDMCKIKSFKNLEFQKMIPQSILNYLDDSLKICEYNIKMYYNNLPALRTGTRITLNYGYENSIKKFIKKANNESLKYN